MRVHRQVERAQQRASQLTVVSASVFFRRTDDHHAAFDRRDIFFHSAENGDNFFFTYLEGQKKLLFNKNRFEINNGFDVKDFGGT